MTDPTQRRPTPYTIRCECGLREQFASEPFALSFYKDHDGECAEKTVYHDETEQEGDS